MLTSAASWLTAANAGCEPRVLLSITDGSNEWKCLSGHCSQMSYPIGVVSVSSVASDVDPLTRKQQSGECTIEVCDSWIRPILVTNRLKGKRATITYGFSEIRESDFLAFASGPIEEISPDASKDNGTVVLSVMDAFATLIGQEMCATWLNKHPLTILYDGAAGKSILSRCGFNASTWVDESSFDPTAYVLSIGHWCVSRINAFAMWRSKSAGDLISELCQLMTAQVVSSQAGILQFKRFDSSAAAVDNWTVDDIIEGSFKQDPLDTNVVNQVVVRFGGADPKEDNPQQTIILNDATSQAAHAYPDQTTRVISHEITTEWVPGYRLELKDNISDSDSSFVVWGQPHSICGSCFYLPGPQVTGADISVLRPAYLLLDTFSNGEVGWAPEIVKAEGLAGLSGYPASIAHWFDFTNGNWYDTPYYYAFTYSSVSRAQLGTTAHEHKNYETRVWDITSIVDMAKNILDRFANGCPVIEFSTPMTKMPVEMGDLVTVTYPGFLDYGLDGITTSQKWEVVSKEPDPMGSPPQIKWRLAYAGISASSPQRGHFGRELPPNGLDIQRASQSDADVTQGFVTDGLTFAPTSGLKGTFATGTAVSGPSRRGRIASYTHTFTASKDTYVAIDPFTGSLVFHEVANGAAQPTKEGHNVWLAKVVTDGSDVTSSTDLRETLPIVGSKLKVGTGPLTHLAQSTGVLDNLTSITTRSLDDITDGATYAKVKSAGLTSGVVNSSGLVAGAVTTAKIAENAVNVVQTATDGVRSSLVRNTNFLQRSRG